MEYMDRVQFAHSIDTGCIDYNTALVNNFDQLMGLYGFIQPCNYKTEIKETRDNILVLHITFPDGDSALKISNVINSMDKRIFIYNRIFSIDVSMVSLNTLQMKFITEQ